ncbi:MULTISPECIES: FAD-binding protein [Gordonia]|uniref:FAD-binding protein n=1 Tax=Gordonia TaxID=2053 RepID=UPI0012BB2276|nr:MULTISPECIES: FAD-binding protein [Gordonia]MDH3005966.1 FAD-binding protein [Gordonia alkanivorans]MDH3015721.1 FAD-binding protein [Gordonia alkanivorans]MDH3040775.1 FAD-binding protein [Gordonia alkanivorans]MDH3059175.1 FAD-binding protein [Gordonia alkanivorans]QGP90002.1 FAD-binding protein [Gordonia sp. 135]
MATSTEIPETVALESVTEFSDEVDVVVIGFGIAGGCAAAEAAANGARVLLIERAAAAGGTTSLSGGFFYLGGGTAVQKATGQDDSPEEMEKYLTAVSIDPEADKIHAYCVDSVDHFNWLEGLGFTFERSFYPEKAVIQPGTEGLMYTGNEKVWPFKDQAVPAPRGHKVPVPGETGGASLVIDLLVKRLGELGVEVRYETGARQLVVDSDGTVAGVTWKRPGEEGVIRATSVIIAAGGFVMNPEMVAEHTPHLAEKPFVLGNTYDDGLGLRMGRSVGAELKYMDKAFITAPIYPPASMVMGVIVNKFGERFVTEDSYHARTSGFILEQPDSTAYLIVDESHMNQEHNYLIKFIDGYESIAEMEAALGIPEGNLQQTMARYNENAAKKEDPDFHKAAEFLEPQDKGPWAVYDLSLGKAVYAGFTMGGMATSLDGEVLDESGSVINGLYAAGASATNIAQDCKGYCSGTQLGEGSYFGRRAGRHAAAKVTSRVS